MIQSSDANSMSPNPRGQLSPQSTPFMRRGEEHVFMDVSYPPTERLVKFAPLLKWGVDCNSRFCYD